MIKVKGYDDKGTCVMLLGLSRENLKQLQKGNDIVFDGQPFGAEGKVQITFGETEAVIAKRLGLPAFEPRSGLEYVYDPVTGMKVRKSTTDDDR
jgi:hypothetical protein